MREKWDNVIVPALVILVAAGAFVWITIILISPDRSAAQSALFPAQERPFDHSNCQYPFRKSNPVNGCDNSDPADPIKAAKGVE